MLTATQANEILKGTLENKTLFYRTYLAWLCGKIESNIRKTAEQGNCFMFYPMKRTTNYKFFPVIVKLYEEQGYYVWYHYKHEGFVDGIGFCWDTTKLPYEQASKYCNTGTYHTPVGVKKLGKYTVDKIKYSIKELQHYSSINYSKASWSGQQELDYLPVLIACAEQVIFHLESGLPIDKRQDIK